MNIPQPNGKCLECGSQTEHRFCSSACANNYGNGHERTSQPLDIEADRKRLDELATTLCDCSHCSMRRGVEVIARKYMEAYEYEKSWRSKDEGLLEAQEKTIGALADKISEMADQLAESQAEVERLKTKG